jgi:hypothetical protein
MSMRNNTELSAVDLPVHPHGRSLSRLVWLALVLGLGGITSCNSSSGPVEASVGPSGGQLTTADGAVTVTIPAGALDRDLKITVTVATAPVSGTVGQVYEIGPSGTVFKQPVTVSLAFTTEELGGQPETSLALATLVDDAWVELAASVVDASAKRVTATTTHLSLFGKIVGGPVSGNCPASPPQPGDLCQKHMGTNDLCLWDYSAKGGGITQANCDGASWWVAVTPSGCPVDGPPRQALDGKACGSLTKLCQYMYRGNALDNWLSVTTCKCVNGAFQCVDTTTCPDPKKGTFYFGMSGMVTMAMLTTNLRYLPWGTGMSATQQCAPRKAPCQVMQPPDYAPSGPSVTAPHYRYTDLQCTCVNAKWVCNVVATHCPTAFSPIDVSDMIANVCGEVDRQCPFPDGSWWCGKNGYWVSCTGCVQPVTYGKSYSCTEAKNVSDNACGSVGNLCEDCTALGMAHHCVKGKCVCEPETDASFCLAKSANCGLVTGNDNCGKVRTVNCGSCAVPQKCNAAHLCEYGGAP